MTPEVLRVMMLDIVPTELANKMNSKVKNYPAWQHIVQHMKEKHDWRRQYQISQALTEQLASSMQMRLELSPELTNHRLMRNRNCHRLVSLVLKSPTL